MYMNCNTFYTKANMRKIYGKIISEYEEEYYENGNSIFSDFEDFADWYINKIMNNDIIDDYENLTGTICVSKADEEDILDNVLSYICDNVDGGMIESRVNNNSHSNSMYDYDSRAFF